MKRLVIGAAVVGGAAFALHRFAGKAHTMHEHCRDMIAACQESKATESSGCGY